MHVLNLASYRAWRRIDDQNVKFWVRQWLDGLWVGAHPIWCFSPMGSLALNHLSQIFRPPPSGRDWGRYQRAALASLGGYYLGATRRALNIEQTGDVTLETILASLMTAVTDSSLDTWRIRTLSAAASAEVLYRGISASELFVRAGTGIIDASGRREGTWRERAIGFIEYLGKPASREYLCCTRLLQNGEPPSKTLHKLIQSSMTVVPSDVMIASALEDRCPVLVTKTIAGHTRSAFHQHRVTIRRALEALRTRTRTFSLHLDSRTSVMIVPGELPPTIETVPRTETWQTFARSDPTIEPGAIAEACLIAFEDPGNALRIICDVLDRQLGPSWQMLAIRKFRQSLSFVLTRDVISTVKQSCERWKGQIDPPHWVAKIDISRRLDLLALRDLIISVPEDADYLLANRLDQAVRRRGLPAASLIEAHVNLANGIRNVMVHGSGFPLELESVLGYLFRYLLAVFVTVFPEARRKRKNKPGPA